MSLSKLFGRVIKPVIGLVVASFIYYIFALLAAGCDNAPAIERVYAPYKYDGDPDWWSEDELWEDEDEEDEDEDEGYVPVKKQVVIDAVSGLVLDSDDTKKDAVVATLALPSAFSLKLPENIENNALFTIDDSERDDTGEVTIVINSENPLGFGVYRVIVRIDPNDGINAPFYKKIEFTVAKTPPPFKAAPLVYPYITGIGKNKLTVTWSESPIGAQNFQVYVGTAADNGQPYGNLLATSVQTIDITDIEGDETDGGLPDGVTYYVRLTAINVDGESALGPPGIRSTSFTLHEGFYKDVTNKIGDYSFYSWDSYSGDGGGYVNGVSTHKGGGDMYIISPPSEEYPGGYLHYGPVKENDDGSISPLTGFAGRILYHGSWTNGPGSNGKWGEKLNGVNGVFIIEYWNHHIPPKAEGYYMGIYYYGLDSVQTVGPPVNSFFPYGLTTPVGLNICYFGNSYDLAAHKNPEAATAEIAIDRFTQKNMGKYIAFIAVPWYRKYEK